MSLVNQNYAPGMGDTIETIENTFLTGRLELVERGADYLDSTSVDAGSSPTTLIRGGMILGRVTATRLLKPYSPSATDGTQIPICILLNSVNVFDARSGANIKTSCSVVWSGRLLSANLINLDENARRLLGTRFSFDDGRSTVSFPVAVVAKSASYTVTEADSGTLFTTTGASAAVTFTLPAPKKGLQYRFFSKANQNMVVAGPANSLVALNNLNATSITFSTANQLIGACVHIEADETGAKYLVQPMGPATGTIA